MSPFIHRPSPARLVAIVCAAQVFVQIGSFFWPALMPGMMERWSLSNSAAGWITAAFYGAYLLAVPVLVTLTDRVDAKHVYLFGVGCTVIGHLLFGLLADGFWSALLLRSLAGIGWAGTYMTGLKLLADQVDAKLVSRAATGHAASIGISGSISFVFADFLAGQVGWQMAFVTVAGTAAIAWVMVALLVPGQPAKTFKTKPKDGGALYDFRPVLANRSAMAYAIAYCVHTLEMNSLRGWGVAFLGYVAVSTGTGSAFLSPTTTITLLGLLGTLASVLGNEASIRLGRRRLVTLAMMASILLAGSIGFLGTASYELAAALIVLWGIVIWLDSSSLTAGAAGTAEPSRRGATLAIHSMLGYAGGFIGPLMVGLILDMSGGMSRAGWGAAFLAIAVLMLAALAAFVLIRPQELAGDKGEDNER
jgi:predicted MFS family arabinose efflux permease